MLNMKLQKTILGGAAAIVLAAAFLSHGQNKPVLRPNEVMRQKLVHAQRVLEGIATENHSLISSNAQSLIKLSQARGWKLYDSPDYVRYSTRYKEAANALSDAARIMSVDGATVAYFQLTVSCVGCHRYLRGLERAALDDKTMRLAGLRTSYE